MSKIKRKSTGEKKVNEQEMTSNPLHFLKSVELTPLFYCVLKSVDITCVDITSVDMTSADSEKRLKDMSSEGQKQLVVCLQPNDVLGNDYRRLADKLGYRNDYIKYLGSTDEPVKTLIKEKGDMKILELIPLLEDMGRNDVVEELQKSLSRLPSLFCFLCLTNCYLYNIFIALLVSLTTFKAVL